MKRPQNSAKRRFTTGALHYGRSEFTTDLKTDLATFASRKKRWFPDHGEHLIKNAVRQNGCGLCPSNLALSKAGYRADRADCAVDLTCFFCTRRYKNMRTAWPIQLAANFCFRPI